MKQLEITGLSKTYSNGVKALDNVSLSIGKGIYGLLGANGAGKSTLMEILATLQPPTSGQVRLNGIDAIKYPQKVRRQLGYLPQHFGVYPKISAQRLLTHFAILKGILDSQERREQVKALLQQTNLYAHRKKAVHTFSGGMRQRFGIAQALLGNPQLIIVDEPTSGLDPGERNRFLDLMGKLGEHIIIIYSTHLVEDVYDLCSNVAIIKEGQVVEQGKPHQLSLKYKNSIWKKTIPIDALEKYDCSYQVLSTRLITGKKQIRIYSDDQPETGFVEAEPTLEDVFFITNK